MSRSNSDTLGVISGQKYNILAFTYENYFIVWAWSSANIKGLPLFLLLRKSSNIEVQSSLRWGSKQALGLYVRVPMPSNRRQLRAVVILPSVTKITGVGVKGF